MFERHPLYTLSIGLNDKDVKRQIIPTADAERIINNEIAKRFDGGTVFPVKGIYKHENGMVVFENTIRVEIIIFDGDGKDAIFSLCDTLKKALNQESIAIKFEIADSMLY